MQLKQSAFLPEDHTNLKITLDFQEILVNKVHPLVFHHIADAEENKRPNTGPHLKACYSPAALPRSQRGLTFLEMSHFSVRFDTALAFFFLASRWEQMKTWAGNKIEKQTGLRFGVLNRLTAV